MLKYFRSKKNKYKMKFDVIQQSFLSTYTGIVPVLAFLLILFVRAPLLGVRNATRDSLPNPIYKNLGRD